MINADDPRIQKVPESGCWIWTGPLNRNGYARVKVKTAQKYRYPVVHRILYELRIGAIPTGFVLDHLCRVRCCVNPDHMNPVTPRDNTVFNSNSPPAKALGFTVCPKCFSDYTRRPSGRRECRNCKKLNDRASLLRRQRDR